MTAGQVAGLLAAFALLVLVIFIGIFLTKLVSTLDRVNHSLNDVTKDINAISKKSEGVLTESRQLINEVNHDMNIVRPVFKASADLGKSVSNVNQTVSDMGKHFKKRRKLRRSRFYKLGALLFSIFSLRKHK
ncbi:DUF948 domain-containing protein [Acetilactobacillus jinshanensis]|uniref:DUF948 domain-containing protein n=1 Tax=Acetilactobacillus jinshanensis TaxID=1720083 RepID=A0A4P6ZLZ5_9LACO|nr:DUF948 domain-containing protein [Acetilactobacillus jinshanensis]QBP18728.1 DUF948 domain-containing protein [Acetilactobacillus jinshanensis]URL61600.1 DUF948 domain-containing protein [uncultured bacterium]